MQEHEHVITLLKEAKIAAQEENVVALKQLSDKTIHAITLHQDTDNVLVGIIIYSLAKLIERKHNFSQREFSKYLKYYLDTLDFSQKCIKKDNCVVFRDRVKEMMGVPGLSRELKASVRDVFHKAKINKASKVYEHGISMESTAKLLGVSLWELAEYVGQTGVSEMKDNKTIEIRERIKTAMEIFK